MGSLGIIDLKIRVGRECSFGRGGGASLYSGGINVGGVRGDSHSVTRGGCSRGQLQEWELPRALNLERESCEHLRYTHLEQVQYYTDLSCQVTFPAHTERGKMGPWLG